jgi:hypothetical protein
MMATGTMDGNKQWCRLAWRLEALRAGFTPEVANRLAFWRWLAVQRGEHEQRIVLLNPAPLESATAQLEASFNAWSAGTPKRS